ncbi:MAG: hypothetical protein A2Z99_03220 [Treponema sp. GWB1_62_6]|nr:MAG: hypothetical protein A2001_14080 [Treponema sp. GWC1_61_84]OHE67822.1 MAG: hypothetical protein A2Z99_03220 [Treponema sp. GWB1_62_6]HCM25711.1 hypothetical protein [Treponema sp.]
MLISICYNESRKKTLVRFVFKIYEGAGARKVGYIACDADNGTFEQTSDYTSATSAILISVLPVSALFVSMQKYFVKGMTVGALKG